MSGNGSPYDFPCDIPVKIFGRNDNAFRNAVLAIVTAVFPEFDSANLSERASRRDRFLSITVTVHAEDRAEIDALYTRLTAHEAVLMVL